MKKAAIIAYEKLCNELKGQAYSDIMSHWYLGKFKLFLKKECGLEFELNEQLDFDEYLHENTGYVNVRKNIMREIKSILNNHNIDVVFFKGEFISRLLYDNCIRPVGDLDFYVSSDKLEESLEILKENGFEITDMNSRHHYRLKKNGLKIELHRHILNPFTKIRNRSFLENLVDVKIDGENYKTFDLTGTFLHLIYHLYMDSMLVNSFYSIVTKCTISKARRYEYRVYEIASFIELYFESIDIERVCNEIAQYTYSCDFIYMLDDIYATFFKIQGMKIVKKIREIAVKCIEKTDDIKKYLLDENSDCATAMSNYLSEQWCGKTFNLTSSPIEIVMNNEEKVLNKTGTYILGESPTSTNDFSSIIKIEKQDTTVSVKVEIEDDVLVFDNERKHNSCECDCVGIFLVNHSPYIYKQFFVFPYYDENKNLCVDVVDNITRKEESFEAVVSITKKGYNVEIEIPFASFGNENNNEFYMEIHIADCDEKGKSKKTTFALSGKNELWFDPCNYSKFIK